MFLLFYNIIQNTAHFCKMPKVITNSVVSTKARPNEYYIRDKVCNLIYRDIIESTCVKQEFFPYDVKIPDGWKLFTRALNAPAILDININKLETSFDRFGDDVKQLMDITTYLEETLKSYSLRGSSPFGRDGGNASFEYKQTSTLCGVLTIYFNWSRGDEMGLVDWEEDETHVIPGVIYQNHKYYAVTNPFIDWLRTPDKPKRQAFMNELFYQ